jgi:hypothetical protein
LHSIRLPVPSVFDLKTEFVLSDDQASRDIPVLAPRVRTVVAGVLRVVDTIVLFKVGLVGGNEGILVFAYETSSLIGRRFNFIRAPRPASTVPE